MKVIQILFHYRFIPLNSSHSKDEDDLLFDALDQKLKGIVSQKKQIEVQFRDVIQNGQIKFGAVINVNYQWVFDRNCKN